MNRVATLTANMIRVRTRKGKGVATEGGAIKPLRKLEKSTVERRKRKQLHPETKPSKSNLTETGQMLDSIEGSGKKGEAVISYSNQEAANKAGFNRKKRPFENLSRGEIRKITKFIEGRLGRS